MANDNLPPDDRAIDGKSKQPIEEPDLSLRPERISVTRLSRKALIALGGGFAIIIGSALIFALQSGGEGVSSSELFATGQKPAADALADLPQDYEAIPKLGPPLPGDLGGPILDAGAQYDLPPPAAATPPVDPAIAERKRQREAALASALFNRARSGGETAGNATASQSGPPTTSAKDKAFESLHRLQGLTSPNILQSGTVIAAALITGIRSDVAGQVSAQVTQNIYDSPTGRILLIPQGAKLVGTYDRDIGFGQNRLGLIWNRLILPNGKSLVLDGLPGSDAGGFAGLEDGIDHHWDKLALAAGLSTILSVGAQAGSAGESDIARAIRDGISDTAGRTGEEIVGRQLAVPPTITIRPGYPLLVLVHQDLVLEPYSGA